MVRRPSLAKGSAFLLGFIGIWLWATGAGADLATVERRITTMEKQLEELKQGQMKILEGQKALSEEHKQLRYWIHKR